MRALLALLFLAPAVASAGVDFKCDSLRYEDQVGGWLRLENHGGSLELVYWNGYPPITLVDAPLDAGHDILAGHEFESEASRENGAVATVRVPGGFLALDSFAAHASVKAGARVTEYDLRCVRH
jgi:hypothetical protein